MCLSHYLLLIFGPKKKNHKRLIIQIINKELKCWCRNNLRWLVSLSLHQRSITTNLRDTMLPSSAGRLLILLDERSRYTRLCSLAMSGGMRDRELSLRCRAVRWVRDQRAVLRLLTRPVGKKTERQNTLNPFQKIVWINRVETVNWFHNKLRITCS